jgi:hypothetical protein
MLVHDRSWGHDRGGWCGWLGRYRHPCGEGWQDYLWSRRAVAERGVRAHLIVVAPPALDHDLCLAQAVEDLAIEQLVAVDRRQRHLRGRDAPQAVALDGEGVVGIAQVTVRGASGQLSPYRSDWAKWTKNPPSWMADWAFTVRKELATSKAIRTHKFGLTQFVIGKPAWEAYLKGDESNPKKALAKAKALVLAEVKKSRSG